MLRLQKVLECSGTHTIGYFESRRVFASPNTLNEPFNQFIHDMSSNLGQNKMEQQPPPPIPHINMSTFHFC